jgi:uncharacterized protein YndB with AHSA1/START domain
MTAHEFEIRDEITLAATPEQVWDAIATGPGLDSWFMGHSEIEPREGGTNRLEMPGYAQESTITAWQPGRHLAFRGDSPDGTFMASEFLIEGRDGGSSVLRAVQNGLRSHRLPERTTCRRRPHAERHPDAAQGLHGRPRRGVPRLFRR